MDGNEVYMGHEEFIDSGSTHTMPMAQDDGHKQQLEVENVQNEDMYVDGDVGEHQLIQVQGEDGTYYVMVGDHDSGNDIDLISQNDIQIVLEDDGEGTIYVGNEQEYPSTSSTEKKVLIDGQSKPDEEDLVDEDDPSQQRIFIEQVPQGLKNRKNRQYGNCKCPECGSSFVNSARLERHLAVHQVFGSYLCPLCGKTFKYEYNLFYHWRKTCRDLNELVPPEDRLNMDVNAVRQLVEDIAQKKSEIGPIDIGISKSLLFTSGPLSRLEMPPNPLGRRGSACHACGVVVPSSHMDRHMALHRSGRHNPDERSVAGGFFCDLCGLVFRQHQNLIKHWRTSCPEIQANLPDEELTLDDNQLRSMVCSLLKRAVTSMPGNQSNQRNYENGMEDDEIPPETSDQMGEDGEVVVDDGGYNSSSNQQRQANWGDRDMGIVFADDFGEEDEMMVVGVDGTMHLAGSNRTKWAHSSTGVQCNECYRMFANNGRLERHLAGFHSNFGAHHCVLCGNRFKYEYNLLYHYRKSCPYTKAYIDRDVREQMDASSLRKLVRQLAQKEVRLAPNNMKSETLRLMNLRRASTFNDHRVAKDMRVNKTPAVVPPQLLQPRAGIPDARPCPICSVIFYGQNAVDRHIQAAHNMEPGDVRAIQQADNDTAMHMEKGIQPRVHSGEIEPLNEYPIEDDDDELEPPPMLERQEPIPEEENQAEEPQQAPIHIRFVDQMGAEIQGIPEANLNDLRALFENGSLSIGVSLILSFNETEFVYDVENHINEEGGKAIVLVPGNSGLEEKQIALSADGEISVKPNSLGFDDNILEDSERHEEPIV